MTAQREAFASPGKQPQGNARVKKHRFSSFRSKSRPKGEERAKWTNPRASGRVAGGCTDWRHTRKTAGVVDAWMRTWGTGCVIQGPRCAKSSANHKSEKGCDGHVRFARRTRSVFRCVLGFRGQCGMWVRRSDDLQGGGGACTIGGRRFWPWGGIGWQTCGARFLE